MNLAAILKQKVEQEGERVTVIYEGREYTNQEMIRTSAKLATALAGLGVARGDRIILQMPNCPEVLQSFGAAWLLGAVIVPINWLVGEEETAYIYRDSGAKVVITSRIFLPKVDAGRSTAPGIETVILIDGNEPGTLSYRQLVEDSREIPAPAETAADDIAALIYTAGTTGSPKGVVHTHYSLYINARMQYETVPLPDDIVTIGVLPLCHSFGIAVMNNGLFRTGKIILLNSFDVDAIFSAIEKYGGNIMAGVPTMYVYMLLHPDPGKYDLSSMKYWVSGSAPLALETWKKFREVFGGELIEGWGLTEAGANNAVNPFEGLKKVGSIGKPMKGTEMRVVDNNGNTLPPNETGEILIGGPMVMKGYWNKPAETAEVLKGLWLHTGDIGYMDEDGYFWITDRKKDLIIKAGENISPRNVEEVLFCHPKVAEAAVVAMKDGKYGEDIRAFVMLKPGEDIHPSEIIEFCRGRLGNFLTPREVVILPAMPKNLTGKILKRTLRDLKP